MTDKEIFEIQFASDFVDINGPYAIIYKDDEYALVAIDYWDAEKTKYIPCIGFKFIVNDDGCHGQKRWVILPEEQYNIINKHIINNTYKNEMFKFLIGEISGKDLMNIYFNNHLNDSSVFLQGGVICDSVTKQPIQRNRNNP